MIFAIYECFAYSNDYQFCAVRFYIFSTHKIIRTTIVKITKCKQLELQPDHYYFFTSKEIMGLVYEMPSDSAKLFSSFYALFS